MERRSFVKLLTGGIAGIGAAAAAAVKAVMPTEPAPKIAAELSEKEVMAKLLSQMDLSAAQWTDDSKIHVEMDGRPSGKFTLVASKKPYMQGGKHYNWNTPYAKAVVSKSKIRPFPKSK